MKRRGLLWGAALFGSSAIAGCTGVLEQESTPTVTPAQTANLNNTQPASQTSGRDFEGGFLLNAFHKELTLSGISVSDLSQEGSTVLLYYTTSADMSVEENNNSRLLNEFLTIASVLYTELVAQGSDVDTLQVWTGQNTSQDRVYRLKSEWTQDWAENEITDAQLLTYMVNTAEDPSA